LIIHSTLFFSKNNLLQNLKEKSEQCEGLEKENGQETPCFSGWVHLAIIESKRFVFSPSTGKKVYDAIVASGWDTDKLCKEKRHYEVEQGIYIFNLAGKLIEASV